MFYYFLKCCANPFIKFFHAVELKRLSFLYHSLVIPMEPATEGSPKVETKQNMFFFYKICLSSMAMIHLNP
jgi:hypothetical protein